MDWIELTVHTTSAGSDSVSAVLMDLGASGTMVEDRADIPDPDKPHGIWEIIDRKLLDSMPADVLVHAWYQPDEGFPSLLDNLRHRLSDLRSAFPAYGSLQLETGSTPDEDWAEVWKSFYKPIRAGKHLVIKPTWETFQPEPGDRIIEMDPGMAFGSGTHETTLMCLELLEKVIAGGEEVIDVGTGSGILAIGAALSGAGRVLAVDIDPDAVRVAGRNAVHNGVSGKVEVRQGDLLREVDAVCDICVANIIAAVICTFAGPLRKHIRPDGLFICSGIIADKEEDVRCALLNADYDILETLHRGEWVAFLSRRSS